MTTLLRQRQFETLVRTLNGDLYRFAYWLCKSPTLSQDLVQESFLRAWRSLAELRDEKAAKAWLMTIVRREYLRLFERKQFDLTQLDDQPIADHTTPPLDEQSDSEVLRQAIGRLDAKYREPLVLQVLGGFSCAEIAVELGISESAVMTQLFRARQKLKAVLESPKQQGNVHELR